MRRFSRARFRWLTQSLRSNEPTLPEGASWYWTQCLLKKGGRILELGVYVPSWPKDGGYDNLGRCGHLEQGEVRLNGIPSRGWCLYLGSMAAKWSQRVKKQKTIDQDLSRSKH